MTNLDGIVRRIPIFQHFDETQIGKVLGVCHERTFQENDIVFQEGDDSTHIFIILEGSFQVRTDTGAQIAVVGEMGLVGEMGVLTHQPRSATVIAQHPSKTLCIGQEDLQNLIDQNPDMGFKIYRNVTHLLCDRLRDNNILLEQQYLVLEDLTGEES